DPARHPGHPAGRHPGPGRAGPARRGRQRGRSPRPADTAQAAGSPQDARPGICCPGFRSPGRHRRLDRLVRSPGPSPAIRPPGRPGCRLADPPRRGNPAAHRPGVPRPRLEGEPMTGPTLTAGTVPAGPLLSMFDPIHVGINEFGLPHYLRIIYKNLLAAGEPRGGKSGLLNILAAHVARSGRSRMVLFEASQVELGMYHHIADEFIGPDMDKAIITLLRLQKVMDNRNAWLLAHRRRKIEPGDGLNVITTIF